MRRRRPRRRRCPDAAARRRPRRARRLPRRAERRAAPACRFDGADRLGHRMPSLTRTGVATLYCGDRPVTQQSIARQWDEVLLAAIIRRDTPRPTVHARNLFHLSGRDVGRVARLRRRRLAPGSPTSRTSPPIPPPIARSPSASPRTGCWRAAASGAASARRPRRPRSRRRMYALGYDVDFTTTDGRLPRPRSATASRPPTIAFGLADGANEAGDYADPDLHAAINDPLIVKRSGTRWSRIPAAGNRFGPRTDRHPERHPGARQGAGRHRRGWNRVIAVRARRATTRTTSIIDPGPPPRLDVPSDGGIPVSMARLACSSWPSELTPDDGVCIDISPGAIGNNPLGSERRHRVTR